MHDSKLCFEGDTNVDSEGSWNSLLGHISITCFHVSSYPSTLQAIIAACFVLGCFIDSQSFSAHVDSYQIP